MWEGWCHQLKSTNSLRFYCWEDENVSSKLHIINLMAVDIFHCCPKRLNTRAACFGTIFMSQLDRSRCGYGLLCGRQCLKGPCTNPITSVKHLRQPFKADTATEHQQLPGTHHWTYSSVNSNNTGMDWTSGKTSTSVLIALSLTHSWGMLHPMRTLSQSLSVVPQHSKCLNGFHAYRGLYVHHDGMMDLITEDILKCSSLKR